MDDFRNFIIMIMRKKNITISLVALAAILSGYLIWSFSGTSGFSLKAKDEVYPCGIASISCTFRNRTIRAIQYGESFTVEHFIDSQWTILNDSDVDINFELVLHTLRPLSSVEITYPVSVYSSFYDAGDYRIVIPVKVGNNDYTLYCRFSVD